MGIKGLTKFIRENFSHVFETTHLSSLKGKRVVIDTSLYMYKFKATFRAGWLAAFVDLVRMFWECEVTPVFIFDTGSPAEKRLELERRHDNKVKLADRCLELEKSIDLFKSDGVVSPLLKSTHLAACKKNRLDPATPFDLRLAQQTFSKLKSYVIDISRADIHDLKDMLARSNVPFYNAPLEAETMCHDLCALGIADAAYTEDSDIYAYGCPVVISNINRVTKLVTYVTKDRLLSAFGMSESTFLDFCIMCGTDNNRNIMRVGPRLAFNYMKEYGSIEALADSAIAKTKNLDFSVLNHVNVRKLFRDYARSGVDEISHEPIKLAATR